jgi:hypothetical protein
MIMTTDFPALTDDLQDIFNEAAKNSIADLVGFKLFNVRDTERRTYDHLILHGIGGAQKVAQGSDLPSIGLVEGDTVTWTQGRYGNLVSVTKDMRLFDLYNEIEGLVRSTTDASFNDIDQAFADVLLNGFSASNYTDVYGESVAATGYDGLALFHASHTNNVNTSSTFSNIITYGTVNPVLSREAMVAARVAARTYKDPKGKNRPINLDTILVAPSKEDEALRIVNSEKISGGFENDINPLKGKVNVVTWEKLETATGGTDTSAYWYMYDSKKVGETLNALFRERPSLDAPEQVYKNKNWDYSMDFYYTVGRGFGAYLRGSNATGA